MTTHRRSPKIDVVFVSCEFTNAASYTDIANTVRMTQTARCLDCGFRRTESPEFYFPAIRSCKFLERERERVFRLKM